MNINFNELLPERLSDKELNNLSIILMELALEFDKQYYPQIKRYYRELERNMKKTQMEPVLKDGEFPF